MSSSIRSKLEDYDVDLYKSYLEKCYVPQTISTVGSYLTQVIQSNQQWDLVALAVVPLGNPDAMEYCNM